jgi:hypothetical protein
VGSLVGCLVGTDVGGLDVFIISRKGECVGCSLVRGGSPSFSVVMTTSSLSISRELTQSTHVWIGLKEESKSTKQPSPCSHLETCGCSFKLRASESTVSVLLSQNNGSLCQQSTQCETVSNSQSRRGPESVSTSWQHSFSESRHLRAVEFRRSRLKEFSHP